jgi:hypothetical protein
MKLHQSKTFGILHTNGGDSPKNNSSNNSGNNNNNSRGTQGNDPSVIAPAAGDDDIEMDSALKRSIPVVDPEQRVRCFRFRCEDEVRD